MVEELCEGWGVTPVLNQVASPTPTTPGLVTSLPGSVGSRVLAQLWESGRWRTSQVRGTLFQEGPRSEVVLTVTVPIAAEEGDLISSEFLTDRSVSPEWAERDADGVMDPEL